MAPPGRSRLPPEEGVISEPQDQPSNGNGDPSGTPTGDHLSGCSRRMIPLAAFAITRVKLPFGRDVHAESA